MATAQTYQLKIYDQSLAQFQFEKTLTGFRARGLETNPTTVHLLPLNIMQAPTDAELTRSLNSRRIPKGRIFLEEILRPLGLAPNDTKGIIDLSRGTSVNDAYSVVPADDETPYCSYNLFDNDFDEVLQVIAYTGAIPHGVLGSGRPSDLTPSGAFPKTWRKIDGQLVLFKAGSTVAAPNYGREPYSEFLAWQVAKAAELNAVEYNLTEWQGKICSTCNLFNTPDVAFVPFELCLPIDIMQLCDFELALAYFENVGTEAFEQFKSMAVFDSLIANTDRHQGNFGILRDNRTGQALCMAPIFDNNVSLFSHDDDEALETQLLFACMQESRGSSMHPWACRDRPCSAPFSEGKSRVSLISSSSKAVSSRNTAKRIPRGKHSPRHASMPWEHSSSSAPTTFYPKRKARERKSSTPIRAPC